MDTKSKTEILQRLRLILKEHCSLESADLGPEQRFQEDLGLDSMGLLTLTVEVENSFHIYLNEDPSRPPQTLEELAELISQRLSDSGL
jgi:acyl carrier protein